MKVYDLLNAGPRRRFTVRGADKRPFIVSNCENLVQATARDVFAEAKLRLWDAGYKAVMSVHDEVVVEVDEGQDTKPILDLMTQTPAWLPGCPIAAEGILSSHYCK